MSPWTILRSSNIHRCRYDRAMQLLFIEFSRSGAVYVFWPVPWSAYLQFRRAKSHGSYFSNHIRENHDYGYRELSPTALAQFDSGDRTGIIKEVQ